MMGGGVGGGAKGQAQAGSGTQNLSMGGGPTEMRTGSSGAFLGQQWDPSQWNSDLGLGYFGAPAGQQQGFAQGAALGSGAKGNAAWPPWSGGEPHPLVQIANHLAGIMGSSGGESDSGNGPSGGEATGSDGYGGDSGGYGDTSEGESSGGDTGGSGGSPGGDDSAGGP